MEEDFASLIKDPSFHGWKVIEARDEFGNESFPLLLSPEGFRFFSLEDVIDFLAESFEDITGEDVLERKEDEKSDDASADDTDAMNKLVQFRMKNKWAGRKSSKDLLKYTLQKNYEKEYEDEIKRVKENYDQIVATMSSQNKKRKLNMQSAVNRNFPPGWQVLEGWSPYTKSCELIPFFLSPGGRKFYRLSDARKYFESGEDDFTALKESAKLQMKRRKQKDPFQNLREKVLEKNHMNATSVIAELTERLRRDLSLSPKKTAKGT